MKKYFSMIILGIILSAMFYASFAEAKEYIDLYNPDKCTSGEMTDVDLSGYKVYEGKVYYSYCIMEGADTKTFKPLLIDGKISDSYAQDKNNVYYITRILNGLKPNNFNIRSIGKYGVILYDTDTIYLDGTDITDVNPDPKTLKVIGGFGIEKSFYYSDKNSLYLETMTDVTPNGIENFTFEKVDDANPDNFSLGYKITPDAVYWYGKKIEGVDVESFGLMHDGYAKDKNNVYKDGKIVYGADTESFHEADIEGVDIFIYIDKNKSYYGINSLIQELKRENPNSIRSIDQSISSAIKDYESKYPNFTPQPAIPKPGSPEEQELKKFEAEVAKAKLEEAEGSKQKMIKMGFIGISGALGLSGVVYGVMKWMGKEKSHSSKK